VQTLVDNGCFCLLAGEKPIKQELLELFRGMWVVFWNAALFLAFADVLHRSLDWCCQVSSRPNTFLVIQCTAGMCTHAVYSCL
jgi:hypothetical protein